MSVEGSWNHHRLTWVKQHRLLCIASSGARVIESRHAMVFRIENHDSLLACVWGQSTGTRNQLQNIEVAEQRIGTWMLNLAGDVNLAGVDFDDRDRYRRIRQVCQEERTN